MLIPNKVLPIEQTLLYKSLQFYNKSSKKILNPKSYEELIYVVILYGIGYIKYEQVLKKGENRYEIRIYKNK